jgi:hypothetical protein
MVGQQIAAQADVGGQLARRSIAGDKPVYQGQPDRLTECGPAARPSKSWPTLASITIDSSIVEICLTSSPAPQLPGAGCWPS